MKIAFIQKSPTMLLAVLALCAAKVSAQDCGSIADPASRLKCFDNGSAKPTRPQANSEEVRIQAAVRASLKDPGSAQFGALVRVGREGACQAVNARNAFGGFTGVQQALLKKYEGQWVALAIHPISQAQCLSVVKQVLDRKSTPSENANGSAVP